MKFRVTFTQYAEYDVDAQSEDAAIDLAYEEFEVEMSRPIAHTIYDSVDVECLEDDSEDDE